MYSDYLIYQKEKEIEKLSREENRARDEAYMQRYTIDPEEYQQKWLPIRTSIFDLKAGWWPEMVFQPGFEFIFCLRETVILPSQFTRLQECMQALGEKEFVLIESESLFEHAYKYHDKNLLWPPCKLKLPTHITYPELIDTGYDILSHFIDGLGIHDYFIFSESGKWGIYSPGDDGREGTTLFTIGFHKDVAPIFVKKFKDLTPDREKKHILARFLPLAPAYQPYDKYLR